jgi:hypothetical protein
MALHNKVIDGVTVLVDDEGVVQWAPPSSAIKAGDSSFPHALAKPVTITANSPDPARAAQTQADMERRAEEYRKQQAGQGGDPGQKKPPDTFDLFMETEVIDGTGFKVKHALGVGSFVLLLARGK